MSEREMNHYLRVVEYSSDDDLRVARLERTPHGWLVILREIAPAGSNGAAYFREEHDDLAFARKACRYYVMKMRSIGRYRKSPPKPRRIPVKEEAACPC